MQQKMISVQDVMSIIGSQDRVSQEYKKNNMNFEKSI